MSQSNLSKRRHIMNYIYGMPRLVRQEVKNFAKVMEYKLARNDFKNQWRDRGAEDSKWFLDRLKDEVQELEEALEEGSALDVILETADVANFAMMIADVFSREHELNLGGE